MTRRERLAMEWALRELRRECLGDALHALRREDRSAVSMSIGTDAWDVWDTEDGRLLRARLALALRALLRADADDYGPTIVYCTGCGWRWDGRTTVRGRSDCHDVERTTRRYTPLWEQARRDR
jgi:hypothetical protein